MAKADRVVTTGLLGLSARSVLLYSMTAGYARYRELVTGAETDERHTQPDLLTRVLYTLPVTPVRVQALVLTPPTVLSAGRIYHHDAINGVIEPLTDESPEPYLAEMRDLGRVVFQLRFLEEPAWRDALNGEIAHYLRKGYRITNGDVWLSTKDRQDTRYGCVPGARVFFGDAARQRWERTGPHTQAVAYYGRGGDSFITENLDLFIVPAMGSGLNGKDADVHLWWDNLGVGFVHGTYFGPVIDALLPEEREERVVPRVSHVA